MTVLKFDSEQCGRIRQHLDAYLSNELPPETAGEVLRHLETCQACTGELENRRRVRDALRRAGANLVVSEELRHSIQRRLRNQHPERVSGSRRLNWAAVLAGVLVVALAGLAAQQWLRLRRGRRIVENVLAIGVSDHVLCAIKGHNYPDTANPPDKIRQKLGPEYAGLLGVVQQKLPGFEVLEAHLCSIPGSPRKYIHFITRGRGTILSVILTRSEGARFPQGRALRSGTAGGIDLYEAHIEGMNAEGFEARGYLAFVVSDLSPSDTATIAGEIAPPLKAAIDAGPELRSSMDFSELACTRTGGHTLVLFHLHPPSPPSNHSQSGKR